MFYPIMHPPVMPGTNNVLLRWKFGGEIKVLSTPTITNNPSIVRMYQ